MEELKAKLKEQIIEQLNLEDINIEDIKDDTVLFGDELGLDSIDALELIVLLENNYSIKIANPEEGQTVFNSVNSMADYITKNRA
jgi:acyl carrier protein